eukprot:scaffold296859_cov33-Tisochrysis_lutea.AAC.2
MIRSTSIAVECVTSARAPSRTLRYQSSTPRSDPDSEECTAYIRSRARLGCNALHLSMPLRTSTTLSVGVTSHPTDRPVTRQYTISSISVLVECLVCGGRGPLRTLSCQCSDRRCDYNGEEFNAWVCGRVLLVCKCALALVCGQGGVVSSESLPCTWPSWASPRWAQSCKRRSWPPAPLSSGPLAVCLCTSSLLRDGLRAPARENS